MNIYTYLKEDHQKVAALFEKIIENEHKAKRELLFSELKKELLLHSEAEHATFYKALRSHAETKEIVRHADKEHAEVKDYLENLSEGPTDSIKWMVLLGELKYSVEHHVEEEEGEMFKKAKQVIDKEKEKKLVEEMESFKEKIRTST